MSPRKKSSLPKLPEITDPERLPVSPLTRYYFEGIPSEYLEDPEEPVYFEAESATVAAMMSATCHMGHTGNIVLCAWRDAKTNEVHRYAPTMEGALTLLKEQMDGKKKGRKP